MQKSAQPNDNPRRNGSRVPKLTPLSYMLSVINDPAAASYRRDKMAIAAAPFVHVRVAAKGKKAAAAEAAKNAGGGEWGDDLDWSRQ